MPGARDTSSSELAYEYAEVFGDGVGTSCGQNGFEFLRYPLPNPTPYHLEAPAASLTAFAREAQRELGENRLKADSGNASTRAHSFFNRWNLSWKVPFSELKHKDQHGQEMTIYYIKPTSFVKFLLENASELVMGGIVKLDDGRCQLQACWNNYRQFHPTHQLFRESHPERSTRNTLAFCFHGDEGRGKKGNTVVMMFETCLGVGTVTNIQEKRNFVHCEYCHLRQKCANLFNEKEGTMKGDSQVPELCGYQAHNTKNNSYLTKFVLSVLPNEMYKDTGALEVVIQEICKDFKFLFEHGISVKNQQWFVALTGLKGDLKWYEKIANLERCFNRQIGSGLQMCHECEAGLDAMPWEDASHDPCWGGAIYQNRPWGNNAPSISIIPCDSTSPEKILRRGLFHNTKVGLLRDYVGSTILFLISLGYFRDPGPGISNARDICLQRAHRHFMLFCTASRGKPGLRSFTPVFFNAKKQTDFGWINAKGSDVTLLMKWIPIVCQGFINDPVNQQHIPILTRIWKGAKCVNTWQHALYNHGLWLPRHCAMVVYQELHEFLQRYNALAFDCLQDYNFTGYAMKSKFHMIAHTKHEILMMLRKRPKVKWIPNPLLWSGEMNEDVVGKLARLSRRVDSRLASKRTVQLYLCKCKAVHKRFLKNIACKEK